MELYLKSNEACKYLKCSKNDLDKLVRYNLIQYTIVNSSNNKLYNVNSAQLDKLNEEHWKCPICGKEFIFKRRTACHQEMCHLEKCKNIQKFENLLNIKFSKEEIENLIFNKFGSINEIHKFCKLHDIHLNFYRICDELNIDHSIFQSSLNPIVKERYKTTCIEHFGEPHNFCKNSKSRKKWEERLLKEEGITNVFQRQSVKDKIKKSLIENFGEEARKYVNSKEYQINKWTSEGLTKEQANEKWKDICYKKGSSMRIAYFKEKYGNDEGYKIFVKKLEQRSLKLLNKPNKQISSLNIKFKNLLDSLNINYTQEFSIQYSNDNDEPRFLYYDFLIDNFIFELNGDYWHAAPTKYKETDIIHYPGNLSLTAKEVWERDNFKKDLAELNGYHVIYIWEHEINDNICWNKLIKIFERYAKSKN